MDPSDGPPVVLIAFELYIHITLSSSAFPVHTSYAVSILPNPVHTYVQYTDYSLSLFREAKIQILG